MLYSKELEENLLSEHRITRTGRYKIIFGKEYADVQDTELGTIAFSAYREGKAKFMRVRIVADNRESVLPISAVYDGAVLSTSANTAELMIVAETSSTAKATKEEDAEKWKYHCRCGHLSGKYLKVLVKNRTEGIPPTLKFNDDDFRRCEICLMAKLQSWGTIQNGEKRSEN